MFVVVKTSFEYNDEHHSVTQDGGGIPVAIFDNLANAESKAKELTISEFLKGWASELWGFGEEMCSIFKKKPSFIEMEEDSFLNMAYYNGDYMEEILDMRLYTDEQLEEIASCLAFKPYEVYEVN
jgi:hypothetical protein